MIDQSKVQKLVEALNLVIPPASLPKDALAKQLAWIVVMSLPGMPPEQLKDMVKALADKPELLDKAHSEAIKLQVQQSVIQRAWSRISSNLPWNS